MLREFFLVIFKTLLMVRSELFLVTSNIGNEQSRSRFDLFCTRNLNGKNLSLVKVGGLIWRQVTTMWCKPLFRQGNSEVLLRSLCVEGKPENKKKIITILCINHVRHEQMWRGESLWVELWE